MLRTGPKEKTEQKKKLKLTGIESIKCVYANSIKPIYVVNQCEEKTLSLTIIFDLIKSFKKNPYQSMINTEDILLVQRS